MCKVFCIEGPDYSGKTQLIKELKSRLEKENVRVKAFVEPGNEYIRQALKKDFSLSQVTRSTLFAADHIQTMENINKSIKEDKFDVILLDRTAVISDFIYNVTDEDQNESTVNQFELQCNLNKAYNIHQEITRESYPDMNVIILYISDDELMKRVENALPNRSKDNYDDAQDMNYILRKNRAYKKFVSQIKKIELPNKTKLVVCNDYKYTYHLPDNIKEIKLFDAKSSVVDRVYNYIIRTSKIKNTIYTSRYNQSSAFNLLKQLSDDVEILLKKKGFPTSLKNNYIQKLVLLNTEIAELADAVKKSLGSENESGELADILIRMCNISSCDEYKEYFCECFNFLSYFATKSFQHYEEGNLSTVDIKFFLVNKMEMVYADINKFTHYLCSAKNQKSKERYIQDISMRMLDMVHLCDIYANLIGKNLQECIIDKMKINHDRPYRYNCSEEMFK